MIDIKQLTIGQVEELKGLFGGVCSPSSEPKGTSSLNGHLINEYVLIRTYSAGVHFGKLMQREGKEAVLNESRRIWSWDGAFTLSKVANDGISSGKLSEKVDNFLVTETIEVMPLTDKAKGILYGIESYKGQ